MSNGAIVVTGATGNIGSVLSDLLLERGIPIRVIGRSGDRLRRFVDRGAEPWEGSLEDTGFLERAFAGARAVFAMIPPNLGAEDFRAYQKQVSEALVAAIRAAGVRHVVNLSSVGAEVPFGTGPIVGLHDHEERMDGLDGVDIIHLRPASFMENHLGSAGMIRAHGANMGLLRADLPMAMIATRDIAHDAAQLLLELSFEDKSTRELLGPRDYTMVEATRILGAAVGRPDLPYVQVTQEQAREGMIGAGLPPHAADVFLEMYLAYNVGKIRPAEPRLPENTTPTTLEDWAATAFAPVYEKTG
jgi:uncharacterized protein YbjT (DUF2867 family)